MKQYAIRVGSDFLDLPQDYFPPVEWVNSVISNELPESEKTLEFEIPATAVNDRALLGVRHMRRAQSNYAVDAVQYLNGRQYAGKLNVWRSSERGYLVNFRWGVWSKEVMNQNLRDISQPAYDSPNWFSDAEVWRNTNSDRDPWCFPMIYAPNWFADDELKEDPENRNNPDFLGFINFHNTEEFVDNRTDTLGLYGLDLGRAMNRNVLVPQPFLVHILKKGFKQLANIDVSGNFFEDQGVKKLFALNNVSIHKTGNRFYTLVYASAPIVVATGNEDLLPVDNIIEDVDGLYNDTGYYYTLSAAPLVYRFRAVLKIKRGSGWITPSQNELFVRLKERNSGIVVMEDSRADVLINDSEIEIIIENQGPFDAPQVNDEYALYLSYDDNTVNNAIVVETCSVEWRSVTENNLLKPNSSFNFGQICPDLTLGELLYGVIKQFNLKMGFQNNQLRLDFIEKNDATGSVNIRKNIQYWSDRVNGLPSIEHRTESQLVNYEDSTGDEAFVPAAFGMVACREGELSEIDNGIIPEVDQKADLIGQPLPMKVATARLARPGGSSYIAIRYFPYTKIEGYLPSYGQDKVYDRLRLMFYHGNRYEVEFSNASAFNENNEAEQLNEWGLRLTPDSFNPGGTTLVDYFHRSSKSDISKGLPISGEVVIEDTVLHDLDMNRLVHMHGRYVWLTSLQVEMKLNSGLTKCRYTGLRL